MYVSFLSLFLTACGEGEAPPVAPAPAAAPAPAPAPEPAAPAAPARSGKVLFVEPADGATVASTFKVVFGVEGMEVRPAGELVDGTGHHHLVVDGESVAAGTVVPADEKHIHYGKGQTETQLTLPPGPHTLTLQFADGSHKSYGPDWSATIKLTVQ